MNPGQVSRAVITDRIDWIERMLAEIRFLPLHSRQDFFSDNRNLWTAESCLRRSLEALFDLGRHLLAKGFGVGTSEYKQIATLLAEHHILEENEAETMKILGGYRNRLVHFYHEISANELFDICATQLGDIELVLSGMQRWLTEHPDRLDESF